MYPGTSKPCVLYGAPFYRNLEVDKTKALRQYKGNYNAQMSLEPGSFSELNWWYDNIEMVNYPILLPNSKVDVIIYTGVSAKGWGTVGDAENTRGRCSDEEAKNHVNSWELMVALFGLKAFCKTELGRHV